MNQPQVDNIYTFKLLTGDEIVAKVVEIMPDAIVLDQPIAAVLSPQGLQLMPALFSSKMDKPVRLNSNGWTILAETRDDVLNSYIQATTGIAPVTKQIITG